ncbi:hypothetical protein H5410_048090 [Solanum commersonii]|uniref:Uncharacterized protein n=1 Tax=Solanum commersonii TaxID=4109 RepID=A0A9J5XKV9_SOLCO|nr:hypothetical protein H5410_048090 [Solanum commersonii]
MADFASTLNSVEKLNTSNYGSWSRECNITFSARNYRISSVDQTPHHQQMLKQQKGRRSKLERPCMLSLPTIKDEDKALFNKRQDYQKKRSSRPGRDKKNQHQRTQQQNKKAEGFNNRKMEKWYNYGKKGHYARTAGTGKLKVM